jgi:hypothetical protein
MARIVDENTIATICLYSMEIERRDGQRRNFEPEVIVILTWPAKRTVSSSLLLLPSSGGHGEHGFIYQHYTELSLPILISAKAAGKIEATLLEVSYHHTLEDLALL